MLDIDATAGVEGAARVGAGSPGFGLFLEYFGIQD
jgi:hypothetical protein